MLVEDVHEAIRDLVQIMQVYNSKNKISKIVVSSLIKRRQEEAEAAVNVAISRLQVSTSPSIGCVDSFAHVMVFCSLDSRECLALRFVK